MRFIEILRIVSDFLFVFICAAAFVSAIIYTVCELFRSRSLKDGTDDALTSSSEPRAFSCVHNVKILPEYFEGVINGTKPFEFRKNDRGYKPGDCVCLKECIIDAEGEQTREIYTGQYCFVVINEVFELGCIDPNFSDYVIFTFSILRVIEGENEQI